MPPEKEEPKLRTPDRSPNAVTVRGLPAAILALTLGLGLIPAPAAGTAAGSTGEPPVRLLLITLDTLRADHLGVYGYGAPTSPALDAFARSATVFDDVTCSMPTTLPSHLTILTGLSPAQHGVTRNGVRPRGELTSIFDLLAGRDAHTAAVVSAKVLAKRYLAGLGLAEVVFGDGSAPKAFQVPGSVVTDQAIEWLSAHGGKPFALWLHYFDTHEPYDPPEPWAQRFAGDYDGPLGALPTPWLVSLNDEGVAGRLSAADRKYVVDLYDAEIAFLDAELERLFAFLKRRGLWHETLVLIVGDHGQAHGENGFWGHGERLLEPVIQVPLLVKLPGQQSSARIGAPVETLDVLPTLAAFYGLEVPAGRSGRSLVEALRGGGEPAPGNARVIERRTYSSTPERRGVALHGGTWKMTVYRENDGTRYHLGRRRGTGGLDGEDFYAPGAEELRLLREVVAARPELEVAGSPLSPETLRMLRALGYVD